MTDDEAPHTLPLKVRTTKDGPKVWLGGVAIHNVLTGEGDGLTITTHDSRDDPANPFEVTLKFGVGGLELDLDLELLRSIVVARESTDSVGGPPE